VLGLRTQVQRLGRLEMDLGMKTLEYEDLAGLEDVVEDPGLVSKSCAINLQPQTLNPRLRTLRQRRLVCDLGRILFTPTGVPRS